MTELWVARDADVFEEGGSIPDLAIFGHQPVLESGYWSAVSGFATDIPRELFPDLKPGECRRLVLGEKEQGE